MDVKITEWDLYKRFHRPFFTLTTDFRMSCILSILYKRPKKVPGRWYGGGGGIVLALDGTSRGIAVRDEIVV